MRLFFIGCIIGIGKILPGVSGSVLAIRLHVYEEAIEAICHFFKNKKDNILFLSKIGLGFVLMTIIGSKLLLTVISRYEFILKIIFTVLIASGIPDILKRSKSFFITMISFILAYMLVFLPAIDSRPNYFIMGIIEAFSTIVPGISGTAIYMSLGWYEDVLNLFANLYKFELLEIIPFAIGLSISALVFIKIIAYLFAKHKKQTYSAILGFLLASVVLMYA